MPDTIVPITDLASIGLIEDTPSVSLPPMHSAIVRMLGSTVELLGSSLGKLMHCILVSV